MFPIILVLFIAVPVIEIGLFIQVGGFIGLWPTIGLVLITAFVGASLVRSQGIQTLLTVQQRIQAGELPAQQILEGVMLAVAGVLLLTPGFMTDMMGMIVLLPGPRASLARYLMGKVVVQGQFNSGFNQNTHHHDHQSDSSEGQTYEGEYERKDDHHDRLK
ncbi:FxsA family protein [Vibrio quintilis]|uniref:Phage T7 F exclusion suppressor FxsA n=1 Tax=Vibrio quintilis TaxID=1117707 RepID=A0A1M7Z0L5_9VIBR|nr:FxsA family protein [Vibrio quintilis]SHO58394.1 phage T7 F exclusion suppressor FxsA [Vibrio quintilis]